MRRRGDDIDGEERRGRKRAYRNNSVSSNYVNKAVLYIPILSCTVSLRSK